jgi:uncharacterized protein YjbI with pentapeptide repeats
VIEVFATYVREHSREQWPKAEPGAEPPQRLTRPDVQAAVTAIGRRDGRCDRRPPDLRLAVLILADLGHADLGHADLTSADLLGANLRHAYLGDGDLAGADLTSADLTGADLTRVNLGGALIGEGAVPTGWQRDPSTGRLKRSDTSSGSAPAD